MSKKIPLAYIGLAIVLAFAAAVAIPLQIATAQQAASRTYPSYGPGYYYPPPTTPQPPATNNNTTPEPPANNNNTIPVPPVENNSTTPQPPINNGTTTPLPPASGPGAIQVNALAIHSAQVSDGVEGVRVLPPAPSGFVWQGSITWVATANVTMLSMVDLNGTSDVTGPSSVGATNFTGVAVQFVNDSTGQPFDLTYQLNAVLRQD